MRNGLLRLAALSGVWANIAIAQSSVTMYGSLGSSIAYVSNENGKDTFFLAGGTTPAWIGLTGTEDLGGDLKAIFKLEDGIVTATGANLVPGEMFGRQAWVALQSARYGRVTLGRQFDITNDFLMPISIGYQTTIYQLYHPANLDNLGSTFYNNAVKYTSVPIHGVTIEGMYGFDDTNTQPGRYAGAGIRYVDERLTVAAVYSSQHDRAIALNTKLGFNNFLGETLSPTSPFVAQSVQIVGVGAMYVLNSRWSINGMYSEARVGALNGDSTTMRTGELGASFQATPANRLSAGGYRSSFYGANYTAAGISDVYSLSKRTALFASIVYQHADGAKAAMANLPPSSNGEQIATYVGMQLFF